MKTLILLPLFILSFMFQLSAQNAQAKPKKTSEEKAAIFADNSKSNLMLTDDQRQKLYTAKLTQLQQREAIKAKYNNDLKAGETDFRANNETFKTSIKSILTPDQYQKWTAAKKGGQKKGTKEKPVTAPTDEDTE